MSKKSHHFLTLWPWPLTYDLEKLIRSGHYHYQCVYQIWEQSIPWFVSYRVNTIAGGGRLRRKTITSPDPSETGDIITDNDNYHWIWLFFQSRKIKLSTMCPLPRSWSSERWDKSILCNQSSLANEIPFDWLLWFPENCYLEFFTSITFYRENECK